MDVIFFLFCSAILLGAISVELTTQNISIILLSYIPLFLCEQCTIHPFRVIWNCLMSPSTLNFHICIPFFIEFVILFCETFRYYSVLCILWPESCLILKSRFIILWVSSFAFSLLTYWVKSPLHDPAIPNLCDTYCFSKWICPQPFGLSMMWVPMSTRPPMN